MGVYLAAVGPLLMIAALLSRLWCRPSCPPRPAAIRLGATAMVLLLCGLEASATRRYLDHWRESRSLFEYMLMRTPDAAIVHHNLAVVLARQGAGEAALEHYAAALRLEPSYAMAHSNMGAALARLGRVDEAMAHFSEALRLRPSYDVAHNNLALALASRGRLDEAVAHYEEAIRCRPDFAVAHANLARALTRMGRRDDALRHNAEAVRLRPTDLELRLALADALAEAGRFDEAVAQYDEALRLKPDSVEACNNLAWTLATRDGATAGDAVRAVEIAERANRLTDREMPEVLDTLAASYAAAGRFDDAVRTARRSVEVAIASQRPDLADAVRERLRSYEARRPCHRTAQSAPATHP